MKLGAAALALALGFPAAPLAAEAQQRAARIGLLGYAPSPAIEAFRRGLRDLGWVEGQNIAIEFRWFQGRPERLPELAEELVKLKLDVILAGSSTQVEPLRQKTRTIPIVFGSHADPVGAGHVASLARPGGNITGVSYPHTELNAKKLEVLKDLIPGVTRIAVLWNPTTPSHPPALRAIEAAARQLEVRIQMVEARVAEDFEGAFSEMTRGKAQAFLALGSPLSFARGAQLAALAVKHGLPGVYDFKENAEAGGLMSYGIDIGDSMRRSAVYVDKILKGAKPAELPVEEAAKFEMVVNLKTARVLGLSIPRSILTRADRVIE